MRSLYKVQVRHQFRTSVKIKIPDFYPDSLFDELFQILEKVNRLYNSYSSYSYTDCINCCAGEWIEVDDITVKLFEKLLWFSDFFEGAYDITVMPLLRLWGFYEESFDEISDERSLEDVLTKVDYRQIQLEGNKIKIGKEQQIVTGSFLKSLAVDCLIEEMHKRGIEDAVVNAGGSSIATINFSGIPFREVLVNDSYSGDKLFSISLANSCLCTSSQVAGSIYRNGDRIGHIIDPRTGYPGKNLQVGIISDSCMVGDICSTAFINWSGKHFSEKMQELSVFYPVSGYLITSDGEVILSGIEK